MDFLGYTSGRKVGSGQRYPSPLLDDLTVWSQSISDNSDQDAYYYLRPYFECHLGAVADHG